MAYLLKKSCAVRAVRKNPKEYRTNPQLIKQDRNEEQHKEEEAKEDNKDNENDHEDMNVDRRTIIGIQLEIYKEKIKVEQVPKEYKIWSLVSMKD